MRSPGSDMSHGLEPVAPGPVGSEKLLVETHAARVGVDRTVIEPLRIEVVEQRRIFAAHRIEHADLIEYVLDDEVALVFEMLLLRGAQHGFVITGTRW